MKLKQKINQFAAGIYLAQGGVINDFFRQIGREVFGIDPDAPGTSPGTAKTIGELITQVLNILLLVAGSIAVVYLIIGGIKYVLSRGNEEKVESAKSTIGAAIWGLVIIIMSFAIIFIISNALVTGERGLDL